MRLLVEQDRLLSSQRWVPGLTEDNIRVGVNWSGPQAVGYDIEPRLVQQYVEAVYSNEKEKL
jgi:hypothetical protein